MSYVVIDIATAPIAGADSYVEPASAPANYKDPEKIAAYVEEKRREAVERCALDPDLGRISAIGLWPDESQQPDVLLCHDEAEERLSLHMVRRLVGRGAVLIGYNALKFDWPYLMRRASYLDVPLTINVDRYRTPHIDVSDRLTHRGLLQAKSLGFYVKRLGWSDLVKPLTGAEEARAADESRWDEIGSSVRHDLIATHRLASWLGVLPEKRSPESWRMEDEPVVG